MDSKELEKLLSKVANGSITSEEAMRAIKHMPYKELGFACADTHRHLRQGFPEAIYAPGKTESQVVEVAASLLTSSRRVLATRVSAEQAEAVLAAFPGSLHSQQAKLCVIGDLSIERTAMSDFKIAVVTAGTADMAVAEEASLVLEYSGVGVRRLYDVGVAGIHRLLDKVEILSCQDCLIVVAGMDGALPSVVGGLVACPVIAVPTSVGYGAGFGGLAPLLTMLNSCAAGVTVVNIDNGYGAAMAALRQAVVRFAD